LKCGVCGGLKSEAEFSVARSKRRGRSYTCRKCQKKYWAKYYRRYYEKNRKRRIRQNIELKRGRVKRNHAWVLEYFRVHPCVDCGETDPVVLEFDHIRGKKFGDVATIVGHGNSLELVIAEVKKCEVVCANCHRRRTARRRIALV